MTTEEEIALRDAVNTIILVVFTALLVVGASTTLIRRFGLAMKRLPSPRLLPRDITLMLGLAWPFVLIFAGRVGEWSIRDTLAWSLITGIPPIIGVATYVYYEIFVIGQPEDWRLVVRTLIRRALDRD